MFVLVPLAQAEEVTRYTVKGVIKALPGNGHANNELLIAHEPIPDYQDLTGKVVGMEAMTMPFYLAEGVSAADLAIGDNVTFEIEARSKPVFSEKVVSIAKIGH
jgi:Cu/Ag efflux protein CusF